MGYRADGVDPCGEFVAMLAAEISDDGYRVRQDALPGLETVADAAYDGLLCSAVLQHIPEEQLFDAAYKQAKWTDDGRVKIDIELLAEKWIAYWIFQN